MPGLRDHEPIIIEQFNGWWKRGDPESCPSDHFTEATNVQYIFSGVETRDGIDVYQTPAVSIGHVRRVYNYVSHSGDSLLVLTVSGGVGSIHHILRDVRYTILTITGMEDFDMVNIAGRAYITPFKDYQLASGERIQMGIKNEWIYVYDGVVGGVARKAGGVRPLATDGMGITNGAAGLTDTGDHLFSVVYETKSGYLTAPGPVWVADGKSPLFTIFNLSGVNKLNFVTIPVSPDPSVIKRHLLATKWIPEYNQDSLGYQFFFIPNATINNNTDTTLNNVEFFDSDLIDDASHLLDNFDHIPSGVSLTTYHSRLVVVGEFGSDETLTGLPAGMTDNRSIARLSFPGEPEAVSKVDGLIIAPMDGNPLTNAQEFRDVLYLFKKTRTYGYSDNNDEPVTWQEEVIDQGLGASVHGIATVFNSGGVNIDYLLVANWSGLVQFNGVYSSPKLSWKIEDYWLGMDKNSFNRIQIVLDTIKKKIWLTIPEPNQNKLLYADYGEGMDAKNIKWALWSSWLDMSGLALAEDYNLVIGAYQHNLGPGPGTPDVSGIYVVKPGLRHDVYYNRSPGPPAVFSFPYQIPSPTIRTALFGE